MNNSINIRIENLKSEFDIFDNPMDRYEYIIDLGKNKQDVKNIRQDKNLIKGCVSKAWMHINPNTSSVEINTDSDALIVKGLLGILEKLVNESNVDDIKKLNGSEILNNIGLGYKAK